MLCTYVRSSSINQHKLCEMRYLFEYVLGMKSPTGKKACLGTIFHKVMEVRTLSRVAELNKETHFNDEQFGRLSIAEARDIDLILGKAFEHYKNLETHLVFEEADLKTIKKWLVKALTEYSNYDTTKLNVVAAELYFDFEIKKDWAKYNAVIQGEKIEGNLRVKGTMDTVIDLGNNVYEMLDYKGLPIETPIPVLGGWSTMGDLKVGDIVFDRFGKQTKVVVKSKQKTKKCYQITFDDTSTVICDDEHFWKLEDGSTVQIKNLKVKDCISVAAPIDCDNVELPIDPYVLGIWLGDGRNREGNITSGDLFVFKEIVRRGFILGENTDKRKSLCEARTVFGLSTKLRKNNLLHNKHIPSIYFRASYEQRLDLLRGLMDSDGTANVFRKQCVFMNCRKELSENVKELLLTLGQRPLISTTTQHGFGLTVQAYPVSFRPNGINPFLLPVKANKVTTDWGIGVSNRRKIRKIEEVGEKLTQCITVDSPDSTYLCTKNMIPTHNTGQYRTDFKTKELKDLEYLKNDIQLLLYLIALKETYPDKHFIMTLFYVNCGGMFSVVADDEMLERAWKMLEKEFKKITKNYNPTQLDDSHRDFRCKYLCPFSKPGIDTNGKSICSCMKEAIRRDGFIKSVSGAIDLKTFGKYASGGGRSNVET